MPIKKKILVSVFCKATWCLTFFLNCKIWDKCYFCTPEYGKIMTRSYARSLTLHVGKQQLTKPTKIERLISMGAFLEDTVRLYSRTDFILTLVGYVVHPSLVYKHWFLVHTWPPCTKISWNTPKSWTKTVLGTMQKGVL